MSSTVGSTTPTRSSIDPTPVGGDVPDGLAAGPQRGSRLPWVLLAPATLLLLVVLGYPIVRMVTLSLQEAKLRNIVRGDTTWNNFENYQNIFADPDFWSVVLRTIVFAAACVAATMLLGTLVALLLKRLGTRMRLLVSIGLLMAWSTPVVTATQVWQWLFDTQYGIVNWALVSIGFDGFLNYSWLANPLSLLTVAGVVVVWGAIPFVALTLYAGLTQVPEELYEAAEVDGATGWRRFWSITFPLLAPIFTILAALSTIWDFRVFTQVFILQKAGGITSETNLLGIYAYRTSFSGNDFGAGAAMSVVMVVLLAGLSLFYVRRMIKEVDA